MTTCKEIIEVEERLKRTRFQVEIDIGDCDEARSEIVNDLIRTGWHFAQELAEIIKKG